MSNATITNIEALRSAQADGFTHIYFREAEGLDGAILQKNYATSYEEAVSGYEADNGPARDGSTTMWVMTIQEAIDSEIANS